MSGRSVNLTTLFLVRLRPPKRLTSTSCTYFRQKLTTAFLKLAEGETKVCGQIGYRIQDPRLTSNYLRTTKKYQHFSVVSSGSGCPQAPCHPGGRNRWLLCACSRWVRPPLYNATVRYTVPSNS